MRPCRHPAFTTYANGRFKDQENFVAVFFNAGNDFSNLLGLGNALVDSVAKLFHKLLELRVHLGLSERH